LLTASCSTSKNPFTKRSPHEKYGDGIKSAGLQNSQLGFLWFTAANKSLSQPQSVSLPYKESGYFPSDKPGAAGYLVTAKRGEKIVVTLTTIPASGYLFFAEIFQANAGQFSLLTTMDTLSRQVSHIVKKDGQFILRLQPELLKSVEYTVTIATSPSLAFPVHRSGDPKLISLWGVPRDGGARKHEGVDIGAKFRTPALASADGRITRVNENEIGGKVVFLTDANTGLSIYYAHLDSQIVYAGQTVRAGDIIGLVGNTGNARNTVPHLHYGIYSNNGAIDPQAFIQDKKIIPKTITASLTYLNKWVQSVKSANIYKEASLQSDVQYKTKAGEAIMVTGATDNWYKINLLNGGSGFINSAAVSNRSIRTVKTETDVRLLNEPLPGAPAKAIMAKGNSYELLGIYYNFELVNYNKQEGWIQK